jgi:hypothetical protein
MLLNTKHWSSASTRCTSFASTERDNVDMRAEMLQEYHSISANVFQGLGCRLLARYHQERSVGPAASVKQDEKSYLVGLFDRALKKCDYSICAGILVSAASLFDPDVFEKEFMSRYYKKTRQFDRVQRHELWEMIEGGDCIGVARILTQIGKTEDAIHVLYRYARLIIIPQRGQVFQVCVCQV